MIEPTSALSSKVFLSICPVSADLCYATATDGKLYRARYTTLSVNQPLRTGGLTVAPQPTEGVCTLSGVPDGQHVAEIFSVTGVRVSTIQLGANDRTLNCTYLPPGAYILRVAGHAALLLKR